jgi:hypothetical protein
MGEGSFENCRAVDVQAVWIGPTQQLSRSVANVEIEIVFAVDRLPVKAHLKAGRRPAIFTVSGLYDKAIKSTS